MHSSDQEAIAILTAFQQLDGPSITDPAQLTRGPIAAVRRRAAAWLRAATPSSPYYDWLLRIASHS